VLIKAEEMLAAAADHVREIFAIGVAFTCGCAPSMRNPITALSGVRRLGAHVRQEDAPREASTARASASSSCSVRSCHLPLEDLRAAEI